MLPKTHCSALPPSLQPCTRAFIEARTQGRTLRDYDTPSVTPSCISYVAVSMETSKVPGPSILNVFTRTKSQLDSEESETRTRTIKGDTSPSAYFVSDHILSNFFSLPRELRDIIYDLAIQDINLNDAFAWAAWRSAQEKDTLHDNPPTSPYPNLLSVNKQIRAEAKDIFTAEPYMPTYPEHFGRCMSTP